MDDDTKRELNELRQEKVLFEGILENFSHTNGNLKNTVKTLQQKLRKNKRENAELIQEKLLSKEIETAKKPSKYFSKPFMLSIIVASSIAFGFGSFNFDSATSESDLMTSGFVIQNLKGDTVDTWISWKLAEGDILNINFVNGADYPELSNWARFVIDDTEEIEIDDSLQHKGPSGQTSTYFAGWTGALEKIAQKDTELFVPHKFNIIESKQGQGDITIEFSKLSNADGYSGYTRSIVDDSQNQILKSHIVIYDVDSLSEDSFKTILRHELGHAFGLAHSTAPEDLMHPTIQTDYPYISECNLDAIESLYDGDQSSSVVCEK